MLSTLFYGLILNNSVDCVLAFLMSQCIYDNDSTDEAIFQIDRSFRCKKPKNELAKNCARKDHSPSITY